MPNMCWPCAGCLARRRLGARLYTRPEETSQLHWCERVQLERYRCKSPEVRSLFTIIKTYWASSSFTVCVGCREWNVVSSASRPHRALGLISIRHLLENPAQKSQNNLVLLPAMDLEQAECADG